MAKKEKSFCCVLWTIRRLPSIKRFKYVIGFIKGKTQDARLLHAKLTNSQYSKADFANEAALPLGVDPNTWEVNQRLL
jgi:hypothetical protein